MKCRGFGCDVETGNQVYCRSCLGKVWKSESTVYMKWFEWVNPDDIDFEWAIGEIEEFLSTVNGIYVDDERGYSHSHNSAYKAWYSFIHDRLHRYGFVNGEPDRNTFDKNPKAAFWWKVYQINPLNYGPAYDHHCSSRDIVNNMRVLLEDLIGFMKGKVVKR
jgi:hypothetical protein